MRISQLVVGAALAAFAVHCQSEVPEAPAPEEKVIESHPGTIVITSPERAAFIEQGPAVVEVRGTGATSALTVNGEKAEVSPDGAFVARVKPEAGLNLVVAADGEARTETAFLYGRFEKPTTPVAHAIALQVGGRGITAALPAASLESVTNLALAKRDLMGAIRGQSFNGTVSGATWTFSVTDGKNGAAKVALAPAAKGLGVNASIEDLVVDGRLSLTALGLTYARDVHIVVESAVVAGNVELGLDEGKATLTAAMPTAETKLEGFRFDTDNAGFPCCVDTILTNFLKPKVELAIRDGIREQLPKAIALSLEGVGVPKQIDFAAAGFAVKLPVATRFDGVSFDTGGATITSSVLFGGALASGTPAAKAPGWLAMGAPYSEPQSRAPALGVSFAIDAVNQLLFATWGSGALAYSAPAPLSAKLTAALPPVITIGDGGAVKLGIGEILVQREGSDQPLAAVTVLADVIPSGDRDALVLTPKGEPTVSITWLSDGIVASGRNLVAVAAKEQLNKLLKPFRVPVPKVALEALGGGFAGQSLAIESPSVVADKKTGRITASGAMVLGR